MSVLPTANHHWPHSRPCRRSLACPFACIYTLLPTNKPYVLLCFLALLIVAHAQTVLLEPDVARLDLYSFHVLILMCHLIAPLLIAHGTFGPLDDYSTQPPTGHAIISPFSSVFPLILMISALPDPSNPSPDCPPIPPTPSPAPLDSCFVLWTLSL